MKITREDIERIDTQEREMERIKSMNNTIVRAQKKPIMIDAFKWENNEPYLRKFMNNDDLIHFKENKLEIWNPEEQSWINVPMFHWIIKGIKGEFYPCSPEVFERSYEIVE